MRVALLTRSGSFCISLESSSPSADLSLTCCFGRQTAGYSPVFAVKVEEPRALLSSGPGDGTEPPRRPARPDPAEQVGGRSRRAALLCRGAGGKRPGYSKAKLLVLFPISANLRLPHTPFSEWLMRTAPVMWGCREQERSCRRRSGPAWGADPLLP